MTDITNPSLSPVEPIIAALWRSLEEVMGSHFKTKYKFSSSLNHLRERRRLLAHDANPNYGIFSMRDKDLVQEHSSFSWVVYNRSAFELSDIGANQRTHQVILSSKDPKMLQIRDFLRLKFEVNAAFATQDVRHSDVFEMLYLTRFRSYTLLEIRIHDEGLSEPLILKYDVQVNPIEAIEQSNEEALGSYWVLPFSLTIDGPVVSPEMIEYPRILQVMGSLGVNKIIYTSDGAKLVSPETSQKEFVWRQQNIITNGRLQGSVFEFAPAHHGLS